MPYWVLSQTVHGVGWVGAHHAMDPMSFFDFPEFKKTDNTSKYIQTFCISTVNVTTHLYYSRDNWVYPLTVYPWYL